MNVDGLIYNARIATCAPTSSPTITNGCVAWRNGKICYVGDDFTHIGISADFKFNAEGRLLTPGLVDCHTHLVFSGNRAQEFEQRLKGISYQAIAEQGGGIMHTVMSTRDAGESELYELAMHRLDLLAKSGVTTAEIKSGYGLDLEHELKILRVIDKLRKHHAVNIQATCLAAHCIPRDFRGSNEEYIAWVCKDLLPIVKEQSLATAIDIFCENIAFSPDDMRTLFTHAQSLGFKLKGHVEQLSQSNGTEVLCEFSALSADHIEYANESQIKAMARSNITAVLLPGAFYYLNETQQPPLPLLRKYNVPFAIATDLNPGSSPIYSLTQAANLACVLFGVTPDEALLGTTYNAALALGLTDTCGHISVGTQADLNLWPGDSIVDLFYSLPSSTPEFTWISGDQCPS